MRMRTLASTFGVLAVLVAAGVVVAPAAVAASGPVVNFVGSVNDDPGTLQVSATADSDITRITAHVMSDDGSTEIGTTDFFVLVSGTNQNGVWQSASPLQLNDLGAFPVTIDLLDAAGEQTTTTNAGQLSYVELISFDQLATNRSAITNTQRNVTVTGRLLGRWPGDRAPRPLPGLNVSVAPDFAVGNIVTTRPNGTFTSTVTLDEAEGIQVMLDRNTRPSPFIIDLTSIDIPITITPSPSGLTQKINVGQANRGDQITITGALSWRSPSGWVPIANAFLGYQLCPDEGVQQCGAGSGSVFTDAQGDYTITTTALETGYYSIGWSDEGNPFIANALATTVDVTVYQPVSFVNFTAARQADGQVAVSGHLAFDNFTPDPIPVQIQYAAAGSNVWTTVATVPNAEFDGTGYGFAAVIDQPAAGNWRAFYAGRLRQFRTLASTKVHVNA